LTLIEAAHYLKVSKKTIQRLIAAGSIPCAKVGGQWRFLKEILDIWLQSQMNVEIIQVSEKVMDTPLNKSSDF